MSIVHKCDICGSIYERNHLGYNYYTIRYIKSEAEEKAVDMCEKCFDRLQDWVVNGANHAEEEKAESDWYSYGSTGY